MSNATVPLPSQPDLEQSAAVSRALRRAAYFPLFSVHSPEKRNVPIPLAGNPSSLIGMQVFEELHRFGIDVERPTSLSGLRATNVLGAAAANVEIDWRVIPDDFVATPDRLPPATPLDPTRSQRFAMYNGKFQWLDRDQSAFHGFGAGRTFPAIINGAPRLYIGAVVEILQGYGKLQGLQGNAVVNGFITPPYDVALNILVRVVDSTARLKAIFLPPLRASGEADPNDTFLVFVGEPDPEKPSCWTCSLAAGSWVRKCMSFCVWSMLILTWPGRAACAVSRRKDPSSAPSHLNSGSTRRIPESRFPSRPATACLLFSTASGTPWEVCTPM